MSQITEAQLRRAIRDQIIRKLNEGSDSPRPADSSLETLKGDDRLPRKRYEEVYNRAQIESAARSVEEEVQMLAYRRLERQTRSKGMPWLQSAVKSAISVIGRVPTPAKYAGDRATGQQAHLLIKANPAAPVHVSIVRDQQDLVSGQTPSAVLFEKESDLRAFLNEVLVSHLLAVPDEVRQVSLGSDNLVGYVAPLVIDLEAARRRYSDEKLRVGAPSLKEGSESASETKYPLVKVLHRACDIFDDESPEPSDGSDNKPTLQIGKRDGKVAFFVSGAMTRKGKQYPLLQKRDSSQHADPAYPSEAALRKAVIDAAAKSFSEHKMLDYFRTIDFGDLQYTELKSGLYGYALPTSIPVRAKSKELKEARNELGPDQPSGSAFDVAVSRAQEAKKKQLADAMNETYDWFVLNILSAVEYNQWSPPVVADKDYLIAPHGEFLDGTASMGDPRTAGIFIKKGTKFDDPDAEYPLFTRYPNRPVREEEVPRSLRWMYLQLENAPDWFGLPVTMQSFPS